MNEAFAHMLAEDGKKNSLGRVNDVIKYVLADPRRIEELYSVMFHEDAWVRMRGADAFEKICRLHPEWIQPYINRMQTELSASEQASIRWHIAQIYTQVELDDKQKQHAIRWLKAILKEPTIDWIVSANCMTTLAHFVRSGDVDKSTACALFSVQSQHHSNAVQKRALYFLNEFS